MDRESQALKAEQIPHSELSEAVNQVKQAIQSAQATQAAQTEQGDQVGQPVQSDSCDQPAQPAIQNLHIVLASKSPRRKDLLTQAGVKFIVHTAEVDETLEDSLAAKPYDAASALAERKAGAVVQELLAQKPQGTWVIIGADTMVVLDNQIFGKPRNLSQAKHMLRALSGRTHQVMTGVSVWLVDGDAEGKISLGHRSFTDVSNVSFHELSDEEIADYLRKGESFDKAGAYAVQGAGAALVRNVEGSIDTVIGLPVERLLKEFPDLRQA